MTKQRSVAWTNLAKMRISPKHYKQYTTAKWKGTPRPPSQPMLLGLAVHTLVLEPHLYEHNFIPWEGSRNSKAFKEFSLYVRKYTNCKIISQENHETALKMADAVKSHPVAKKHLRNVDPEKRIDWVDEETGLPCKGFLDNWTGRYFGELKTVSGKQFMPEKYKRSSADKLYHGQLAFYQDGLQKLGYDPDPPVVITVESSAPYDVVVYKVDEEVLNEGRYLYRTLINKLKECMEHDYWPGIAEEHELTLTMPPWHKPEVISPLFSSETTDEDDEEFDFSVFMEEVG